MVGAPFVFVSFVAMVFLNAIVRFVPLNIFACFVTFLLFLHVYAIMHYVCALPLHHALAPCMVHAIGMHVMHHIIVT